MAFHSIRKDNFFDHDTDVGIIGRGETIENCFADIARVMFSLVVDVENLHLTQIISFEFEEGDIELALSTWLNLLLTKSRDHRLLFSDFRLKRDGNKWEATVSGEKLNENNKPDMEIRSATTDLLSVRKIESIWEARCVIEI